MSIHQRIRDGRLRLGMNEQQFGDSLGVTRGAVQQWEKEGGTAPTRKNQPKVAKLLGISVSRLMAGDGLEANQPLAPADIAQAAIKTESVVPTTAGGQLQALFDMIPKGSSSREPAYNACFEILMQAIRGAQQAASPPIADTEPSQTQERRSAAHQ